MKQQSEADNLHSVSMESPYARQKISLGVGWKSWLAEVEASVANYSKPENGPTTAQPSLNAFQIDVLLTGWKSQSGPWALGLGAVVEDGFRWVKSGPQSVSASNALSLGPAAYLVRNHDLNCLGVALRAPMTGALKSGPYGAQGRLWGEWKLISLNRNWLSGRIEAEASRTSWSEPKGTSITAWAFWLAPVFHFSRF
jgi:hypothetical protein